MAATVQHPACGKTWQGLKPEHCPVCCQTFSTTRAGDRHRKGPHDARFCVDPAGVGLEFDDGRQLWRLTTGDNPWA